MLLYIDGDTPHLATVVSDQGPELLRKFLNRHHLGGSIRKYKIWPFFVADLRGEAAWRARAIAKGMRWIDRAHLDRRARAVRENVAQKIFMPTRVLENRVRKKERLDARKTQMILDLKRHEARLRLEGRDHA